MILFFIIDFIFFTPNLKKSRGYATYLSSIIGWFRISYRVNESWFDVVSCPIRVLNGTYKEIIFRKQSNKKGSRTSHQGGHTKGAFMWLKTGLSESIKAENTLAGRSEI